MTVHPTPAGSGQAHAAPDLVIAGALRDHTAEHHKRAERSDFQRQFIAGRIPVTLYIGWLEQMLCVYRSLEAHLMRPAGGRRYDGFSVQSWRRTPELERDLEHFGRPSVPPTPLPATQAFLDQIENWAASGAPALLGVLYVLEGSTNGSRHIAKSLKKAYELGDGRGLAFMDPYGEMQPDRWREFKGALEGAVSSSDLPELIATAQETFEAVSAIGADLLRQSAN